MFAQNGEVIDGTLRVTQESGTPAKLTGKASDGEYKPLIIGSNLVLTGDTLSATGQPGLNVPIGSITPVTLVGINTTLDTITPTIVYDNTDVSYTLSNLLLLASDTLTAMRGSHLEAYKAIEYTKTLAAGASDTINVDQVGFNMDFTQNSGTYEVELSPHEQSLLDYFNAFFIPYLFKHLEVSGSISFSVDSSYVGIEFGLDVGGAMANTMMTETTTSEGGRIITIGFNGIYPAQADGTTNSEFGLRIKNTSGDTVTLTIKKAMLNLRQIRLSLGFAA